jgi:DNA polymerase-3 subunit epsilon/CBS domain-containing protein
LKPNTGATPLFALSAVAIDTETTGLEPSRSRVIEIGAVRIANGRIETDAPFSRVVNPGIPVPEQSRKFHGIPAAETDAAPPLRALWDGFRAFVGDRVWIGHSTGFDVAILGAEAGRHRLRFPPPRALDIRLLAAVALPDLKDTTLDGLARHFAVDLNQRHRALADASAAAAIFLRLAPALERSGIRTLAEAERACARLAGEVARQAEAGWAIAGQGVRANPLARIDTYAYRHRVGEVMSSPVATIEPSATLADAIGAMVARSVSSLFLPPSPGQPQWGIFTERDAMRKIAAHGAAALTTPVGEAAARPVRTIRADAFVYRAIGRMRRMKFRHLGVTDDAGNMIGAVSARDLLRLRAGLAVALDDAIEEADDARALSLAWSGLPAVVQSLAEDGVEGHLVCRIVSEEIRSMTRRAAALAVRAMEAEGRGPAPCRYCVLVLGSGGRGESLLVPDQDNAIVFADGEAGGANDRWFAAMADRMAGILDDAGIPFCKGGVMAKNPQWRGDVATWRTRIAGWIGKSAPQDLLNVDIFFDAMPVAGDLALGHELFAAAFAAGHGETQFAKLLGENIPAPGKPFTLFGNLKGPRIDLKLHVLFPVATMARALAIRHNLAVRSTRERLEGLAALKIGGEADLARLAHGHAAVLSMLLRAQGAAVNAGAKPANEVEIADLSDDDARELRQVLRDVECIGQLTRDLMFAQPAGGGIRP